MKTTLLKTLMEEGKRFISASDYFRDSDVWYDYEDSVYPPSC